MANHKSAEKRHRQSLDRRVRNRGVRSQMRTAMKEARTALANGAEDKLARVQKAVREIHRARSKNVLTPNTASRYVSRLMRAASGG